MTNYNEILDEILDNLGERHIMVEHRLVHILIPEQKGKNIETRRARQAITSLIKELVAEAKPAGASIDIIETYLQNGMPEKAAEYRGINHARDQFEQNLLKALEEV